MSTLYAPTVTDTERAAASARRERLARLRIVPKPIASIVTSIEALATNEPSADPIPNDLMADALIEIEQKDTEVPVVHQIKIHEIQDVVAQHFGVTRLDIISARRTNEVVWPRQIAMYLAKMLTTRSLPDIGYYFGGRDHTTILHGIRKVYARKNIDPSVKSTIELLTSVIEGARP